MLITNDDNLYNVVLNAPIGICILDATTLTSEMVNDKFLEVAGKPHEAVYGKFYWDAFTEVRTDYEEALNSVVQTGEPYHANEVELMLVRHGKEEWIFVTFVYLPIKNKEGKVSKVAVWVLENTQQVRSRQAINNLNEQLAAANKEMQAANQELQNANEELAAAQQQLAVANEELELVNRNLVAVQHKAEESEVALRLAINAANFGTWFIHSVTREFITDARLKELFGYYPNEDLSIEQALAQITDEYRPFVAGKLENAIYNNGDYDVTYPVIGLHDDRLRWLRAIGNLKADRSGTFSAFTGVVMDITDQYLAAKKVERAEESLRMAIDAAGLGTFYINAADRVFVASAKLKEFFGFRPDEEVPYDAAIGQIHPDYRQQAADLVEAAFRQGTRFDMEYPIIGYHDGKIRWVRGIGEMQHSDGIDYFTGVLHEITEKKADELRKNDFIGMVSHELKTPLTSMTAILQVLKAKLAKNDDVFVPEALERANLQVKKMSSMINGFLNISRLESGKILIDKRPFNFDDLIKEVIDEINLTGPGRVFDLKTCGKLMIHADRDKIGL